MSYPGGKNGPGVYQTIINQQPPHRRYLEGPLGSGAVLRRKRPAAVNIGIDLTLTPFRQHQETDIPGLKLFEGDILEFLRGWEFEATDLIYLDPPYPKEARKSQRDLYAHEMTTAHHEQLLSLIGELPCMVQVSSYANALYGEQLKDWRLVTFQTTTRGGGVATEHLWMNYPEPAALHDTRYLGDSFRERERIKRKRERWLVRLEKMDVTERYAMLSAIGEAFELDLEARQK